MVKMPVWTSTPFMKYFDEQKWPNIVWLYRPSSWFHHSNIHNHGTSNHGSTRCQPRVDAVWLGRCSGQTDPGRNVTRGRRTNRLREGRHPWLLDKQPPGRMSPVAAGQTDPGRNVTRGRRTNRPREGRHSWPRVIKRCFSLPSSPPPVITLFLRVMIVQARPLFSVQTHQTAVSLRSELVQV